MDVVDLLVAIIVVTTLVTVVVGVVTYVAYKLRLARRPPAEGEGPGRYFVRHEPEDSGVEAAVSSGRVGDAAPRASGPHGTGAPSGTGPEAAPRAAGSSDPASGAVEDPAAEGGS